MGKTLPFFEHLDELRRRLLISLGAVAVSSVCLYFFADGLLALLIQPLQRVEGSTLYFFSPQEAFVIKLKITLLAGVLAASPVLAWQIWQFVAPALYPGEKKAVLPLVSATAALFVGGAAFCYWAVLPAALGFLVGGMQTEYLRPLLSVGDYVGFLSGMMLAFGIAFNLPLVVLALVASGLIQPRDLNRCQRQAIVLIFIAAAVLTPGPDIASQLLLALPLVALFELSVLASFALVARRSRAKGTT